MRNTPAVRSFVPLFLIVATAAAQRPAAWFRVPFLTSREEHAMAHDDRRERTVLFGGCLDAGEHENGDTFEYDGSGWTLRRPRHSPLPRRGHGMAYDRARGVVVLFGGRDGNQWYRDTWEYDGVDWRARNVAQAPSLRAGHVMAYDPVRQVVLAYGGAWNTDLLWQWNGLGWSQLPSPNGLLIQQDHCGAFDETRGRLVVFGGRIATTNNPFFLYTDDTWEWDGAGWVQGQPSTRPTYQSYPSSMVYDVARQRCMLRSNGFANWEWDGTNWSPNMVPGPGIGAGSVLVHDRGRARTVAFGGFRGAGSSGAQTWEFNGSAWSKRLDGAPSGAIFPQFVPDSQRSVLELWSEGDAWQWNGARWSAVPAATVPGLRHHPGFARDEVRGEVLCFGGVLGTQWFTDTWIWNGAVWQQRFPAQSPPPSIGPLCHDAVRGRTVLFADLGSMWEWDGIAWWNVVPTVSPPPRTGQAVAHDAIQGGILLHGGTSTANSAALVDSWLWNGVDWQLVSTNGPVLSYERTMAADPVRRRIATIGTGSGGQELWEWDGVQWSQPAATLRELPPESRPAWDPAQQRIVLVSLVRSGEVWAYGAEARGTLRVLGVGCGGALGAPRLTGATPQLGNEGFGLDLLDAPAFAPCLVGLSLGAQDLHLGAGCNLRLAPPFVPFVAVANANGFANVGLPLPVAGALRGLRCTAQGLVVDPTAPLGLAFTAGLQIELGD